MSLDQIQDKKSRKPAARRRRIVLVRKIALVLDLPLAFFALGFLILLLGSLLIPMDAVWEGRVDTGMQVLWAVFVADFFVRLLISPDRGKFLRRSWFDVLVLLLPALRVLRGIHAFRTIRVLGSIFKPMTSIHGLSLFRLGLVVRRTMRGFHRFMDHSRALYLIMLTAIVVLAASSLVLAASSLVLQFEKKAENSVIKSFGDALWWSSSVVTTVACDLNPVTFGGRVLAVALMLYGVFVFGYFVSRAVVFMQGGESRQDVRKIDKDQAT